MFHLVKMNLFDYLNHLFIINYIFKNIINNNLNKVFLNYRLN